MPIRDCWSIQLDEKMEEIEGVAEAEEGAREFIKERHFRVKKILFKRVYRERNDWLMEGEVSFKQAYFFKGKKSFKLRISSETGQVISYEEI